MNDLLSTYAIGKQSSYPIADECHCKELSHAQTWAQPLCRPECDAIACILFMIQAVIHADGSQLNALCVLFCRKKVSLLLTSLSLLERHELTWLIWSM